MNSKKLIFVLIACIAAVLVLLFVLIIINLDRRSSVFDERISQAETEINSGFYIEAADSLDSAYRLVRSSRDALIFLKRIDRLASATGDYSRFAEYSAGLLDDHRRNIEIAAVAAYSQQKIRNYKRSLSISESQLANTDYSAIHLLNILKTDGILADLKKRSKFNSSYGFLFSDSAYTADSMLDAATKLPDQRLYADAALLLMKEGRRKEAFDTIRKTADDSFPELKALIAYDNEDFKSAERYWPKADLFGIDILLRNGKKLQAANACKEFIDEAPDESSIPYRNLYSLSDEDSRRVEWIDRGLVYFPDDENLLVAAAWEYYLNNDRQRLSEILDNIGADEEAVPAGLFRVNMMLKSRSPEHVTGNFWVIFNLDPSSEITAVSFANYLLENKQFSQLHILLQRYTDLNGERDWVYEYSAIEHALKGEYEEAESDFLLALKINDSSMNLYNLGVIQILRKNYGKALETLERAMIRAEAEGADINNTSKMYFKLSETNYNIREFNRAEYFINRAIELNPDDTRSRLMLAKIKEEYND